MGVGTVTMKTLEDLRSLICDENCRLSAAFRSARVVSSVTSRPAFNSLMRTGLLSKPPCGIFCRIPRQRQSDISETNDGDFCVCSSLALQLRAKRRSVNDAFARTPELGSFIDSPGANAESRTWDMGTPAFVDTSVFDFRAL